MVFVLINSSRENNPNDNILYISRLKMLVIVLVKTTTLKEWSPSTLPSNIITRLLPIIDSRSLKFIWNERKDLLLSQMNAKKKKIITRSYTWCHWWFDTGLRGRREEKWNKIQKDKWHMITTISLPFHMFSIFPGFLPCKWNFLWKWQNNHSMLKHKRWWYHHITFHGRVKTQQHKEFYRKFT